VCALGTQESDWIEVGKAGKAGWVKRRLNGFFHFKMCILLQTNANYARRYRSVRFYPVNGRKPFIQNIADQVYSVIKNTSEKRYDNDGNLYSREQFLEYYDSETQWDNASCEDVTIDEDGDNEAEKAIIASIKAVKRSGGDKSLAEYTFSVFALLYNLISISYIGNFYICRAVALTEAVSASQSHKLDQEFVHSQERIFQDSMEVIICVNRFL